MTTVKAMHPTLAILGGGNMARAIISGGLRAGTLVPARVVVAEIDEAKRGALAALGVRAVADGVSALGTFAGDDLQVLLAVKPQSFEQLALELRSANRTGAWVVVSIMAGVTGAKIRAALDAPGREIRVVRAMPNLPAQIAQGATAVCLSAGAAPGDDAFACRLFEGLGPVVVRTREELMDAFTAVAGSGPAYVFYLAEAMIDAAARMGFSPEESRRIVGQTLAGAGALLAASGEAPGELRRAVTSKGGTTQAATEVLDARGVMRAITEAVLAAEARGKSLGAG